MIDATATFAATCSRKLERETSADKADSVRRFSDGAKALAPAMEPRRHTVENARML
jgi:hypothetical protein